MLHQWPTKIEGKNFLYEYINIHADLTFKSLIHIHTEVSCAYKTTQHVLLSSGRRVKL